jgi:hypothetical protein
MTDAARLQLIVFFSVVVSAWVGMHAYVAWRLAAAAPRPAALVVWALLGAGALLWPIVTYFTRQVTSEAPLAGLRQGLWTYFGLFSVVVVLVLARDALLAVGAVVARVLDAPVEPTKRRAFEVASAAAVAGATGLVGVAGWRGATRLAPVVSVDVPIAGLDPRLDGLKIAQISDIHIGQPLTKSELAAIVARTNEIGAHLIAVTGDLVDGRVQVYADDTAPVADLRAPLGVYFVTGNHEYYSGTKPWERLLKERGARRAHERAPRPRAQRRVVRARRCHGLHGGAVRARRRVEPGAGLRDSALGSAARAARAPAEVGGRGRGPRRTPAAVGPHPRRSVLAVHDDDRLVPPGDVGAVAVPRHTRVRESRHRRLGAASARGRSERDHRADAPRGVSPATTPPGA